MEGKQSQDRPRRKPAPAPLSDKALEAIEKGNQKGPSAGTIQRLVVNLRQTRRENEDLQFEVESLRAEKQHAESIAKMDAENGRRRVLVFVDYDGYVTIHADKAISIKVIERLPWDDDETEQALADRSHWQEIWWPSAPRATALPHYISGPNKLTDEALTNLVRWQSNCELLGLLTQLSWVAKDIEADKRRKAKEQQLLT